MYSACFYRRRERIETLSKQSRPIANSESEAPAPSPCIVARPTDKSSLHAIANHALSALICKENSKADQEKQRSGRNVTP